MGVFALSLFGMVFFFVPFYITKLKAKKNGFILTRPNAALYEYMYVYTLYMLHVLVWYIGSDRTWNYLHLSLSLSLRIFFGLKKKMLEVLNIDQSFLFDSSADSRETGTHVTVLDFTKPVAIYIYIYTPYIYVYIP